MSSLFFANPTRIQLVNKWNDAFETSTKESHGFVNRFAKERKEREADQRFLLAAGRESIRLIINTKNFHAQTNRQTRSFHFLTLFLSSIVKRNELYTKENTVGLDECSVKTSAERMCRRSAWWSSLVDVFQATVASRTGCETSHVNVVRRWTFLSACRIILDRHGARESQVRILTQTLEGISGSSRNLFAVPPVSTSFRFWSTLFSLDILNCICASMSTFKFPDKLARRSLFSILHIQSLQGFEVKSSIVESRVFTDMDTNSAEFCFVYYLLTFPKWTNSNLLLCFVIWKLYVFAYLCIVMIYIYL